MADSEILAAIKSLQSHLESQLLVTNQLVKQFISSFDSGFASIQHTKSPLDFSSPSNRSHPYGHPPPTELSPVAKHNCDVTGGGGIPSPFGTTPECYRPYNHSFDPPKLFIQESEVEINEIALEGHYDIHQELSKSRPKFPMEAFALAKTYEARLEESRNESRSGVCEPIKATPFISVQLSPPQNLFPNPNLSSNHSNRQQLGPFIHGYANQSIELNRDGLISATATQSPSTLHPLPQKIDALFQPPAEPPPHRSVDHRIHLLPKTGRFNVVLYRCPQFQEETMAQVVAEMLTRDIIRPSRSPFSSPGCHQIPVQNRDIHKTAIRSSEGHYEFLVMLFGLLITPTFQSAMNQICAIYLHRFAVVFFDDILVCNPTRENQCSYLEQVFERFFVHEYYLKLLKCVFGQSFVDYLGYILAARVVGPDRTQIASMEAHHVLKSPKQLQAFLWFIGYYRWIVSNYASIAAPLTDLLRKDSFSWSPQAQLSFEALKKAISTALVLQLSDFALEFIVETLASNVGIGTVLMHSDQHIAFHIKFWHNLFHLCGTKLHRSSAYHPHTGSLPNQFTAERVVHLVVEIVLKHHGFPTSIISDRDPIFLSSFWQQLFKLCGTQLCHCTAYHPKSRASSQVVASTAILQETSSARKDCVAKFWFNGGGSHLKTATWEDWDNLCATYPNLHLEDKVIVEGGRNVTTSILLLGLQIHPRKWMKKAQFKSHLC